MDSISIENKIKCLNNELLQQMAKRDACTDKICKLEDQINQFRSHPNYVVLFPDARERELKDLHKRSMDELDRMRAVEQYYSEWYSQLRQRNEDAREGVDVIPAKAESGCRTFDEYARERLNNYASRMRCRESEDGYLAALTREVKARLESGDNLTVPQPIAPQVSRPNNTEGTQSTLDDSTPQLTSREGVHLAEQQETVVVQAVDGNVRHNMTRANAHLNENDWSLEKMLRRENLVAAFPWALTDAPGTELVITATTPTTVVDIPSDLLQNAIVASPFLRFQWWRCNKVRVRLQLVASRFHQGRLLVYFWPTCLPKANVSVASIGPTRATQVQHGFLDPSNGTVLDMEIPFRFHKGWVDLVFGDSLGQLHVQVLNQLQAATGASTSVEIKMFVTFDEPHFRVPRPGGSSFDALRREAELAGYDIVKRPPKSLLSTTVRAKPESGVFSKMGSAAGGELDKLVQSVVPAEITGAVAGIMLDKPAVTEFPPPLVRKDAQYMSSHRGVENLERMTFEPSRQDITTTQFGDSTDEMDMKYLLSKRVYLTTFNWASTNNVGDVLYSTIISPAHLIAGFTPLTGVPFEPTPFGYLANLFTYWRGGIVFIFQVVGTAFHEGRLDFCNHVAQLTPPADYAASMSQYVNSQTIRNTNNTVEVLVPMHADTPWKRVWNGENLAETPTDAAVRAMDYVMGSFSVRVATPLKSPNNVANNVDVNVFVAAADDFAFHTMSVWGGNYVASSASAKFAEKREAKRQAEQKRALAKVNLTIAARQESGDLNTDSKDESGVIPLGVGRVGTYDPPVHHFGETYSSLREMCKRYQHIAASSGPVGAGVDTIGRFFFESVDAGGLIGAMMGCYRMFRGPMNFKIQVHCKSSNGSNNYESEITGFCTTNPQPPIFVSSTLTGVARVLSSLKAARVTSFLNVPMVRFSTTQVGEFQIPFQSIYHSLLLPQTFDDTTSYFANQFSNFDIVWDLQSYFASDMTRTAVVTIAAAFGDETRLGVFLGFPAIQLTNTYAWPNPGA